MFWSWQLGYKFLRVDTADDEFRIHLGSTGCQSDGAQPAADELCGARISRRSR